MRRFILLRSLTVAALLTSSAAAKTPIRALIVDGQNNHQWQETTPLLKQALEETGLFAVDVATSPPAKSDMSGFRPNFSAYQVIVLNYNGDSWSEPLKRDFEAYVRGGGGVVSYHAADNSFPDWPAFNEMIGLGGWGGRDEKAGPMLHFRDGKIVPDDKPGRGGHHGKQHAFQVTVRNPRHPITRGLPPVWMHAQDELYDSMRGPGQNITLLATAFSDPAQGGTGEHEPIMFTVSYGKGRVFHTMLGHYKEALECAGFLTTFQRGTEWAATGNVTQKVPEDFPTAGAVLLRKVSKPSM